MKSLASLPKQNGTALLVSIVVLTILTLLGMSSLRNASTEEKMAGNMRDKDLAFQAAEAALRAAEKYIDDNVISVNAFDTNGSDGLYDNSDDRIWKNITWTNTDSLEYSDFDSQYKVSSAPRYVIQHLASSNSGVGKVTLKNYGQGIGAGQIETFLITARATGGSSHSVVMLQSTYGKRL
ncbi:MAG: PilX N-terminal domain-containing pilus assembly protein [Gammaproteobacteria bacterium]|nr:PilX N-terminal domain-containing pilus assembly protein [Gammaproteobacteria bacterium]MDH5803090.1 PilX N-terminal domain-containing pilus assembly protein [Gammaproteobacteria bacterium]